jgi:mRNA interferase HigB
VRIIAKRALREFWHRVPEAQQPLSAWYADVSKADWSSPAAIKRRYASASILRNSRVVFNIAGNRYRLVVRINYAYRVVYVRFVGTHADYDRIDAETV